MRINRNRRRSARPVFSSVNSSRRRAMARRRLLNSNRQRLNCAAEIGDIVTFNELNEAQKQSAIKNIWNTSGAEWIYQSFNENEMDYYHDRLRELVDECNAKITELLGNDSYRESNEWINPDELYWQSNSHGPYAEWRLNNVFSGVTIEYINPAHIVANQTPSSNGKPAVEAIDLTWSAYGDRYDANDFGFYIEYFDPNEEDWIKDGYCEADELADPNYGIPQEIQEKVKAIVAVHVHFLETAWEYINDVCTAYPDDAYAYDLYEANDWGDFEVIDDETAEYYNDVPDDFNTYY